jgi:hypothetical protein
MDPYDFDSPDENLEVKAVRWTSLPRPALAPAQEASCAAVNGSSLRWCAGERA